MKLARRILRDSQRAQPVMQQWDNRICHLLSWLLLFLQTKVFPNQLLMLLLMLEAAFIVTSIATWRETVLSHIEVMTLKGEVEEVVGDRCLCFLEESLCTQMNHVC